MHESVEKQIHKALENAEIKYEGLEEDIKNKTFGLKIIVDSYFMSSPDLKQKLQEVVKAIHANIEKPKVTSNLRKPLKDTKFYDQSKG